MVILVALMVLLCFGSVGYVIAKVTGKPALGIIAGVIAAIVGLNPVFAAIMIIVALLILVFSKK